MTLTILSLFLNVVVLSFIYIERKYLKQSILISIFSAILVIGSFASLVAKLIPEIDVIRMTHNLQAFILTFMPALILVYIIKLIEKNDSKQNNAILFIFLIPVITSIIDKIVLVDISTTLVTNIASAAILGISHYIFHRSDKKSPMLIHSFWSIVAPITFIVLLYVFIGSSLFQQTTTIALFGIYVSSATSIGLFKKGILLPKPIFLGHIRTQIFAAFLLISAIVIILSSLLIYTTTESISKDKIDNELSLLLHGKTQDIKNYSNTIDKAGLGIMNIHELEEFVKDSTTDKRKLLINELEGILEYDTEVTNISVFSPSGSLLLNYPSEAETPSLILENRTESFTIRKDTNDSITIEKIFPIYSSSSEIAAYLVLSSDYNEFAKRVKEHHENLYESLLVYVVDESGNLLTPRGNSSTEEILVYKVPQGIYDHCFSSLDSSISFEGNIENEIRIFTVQRIEDSNMCIISSIEKNEVNNSIKSALGMVFIITFFSLLFATVITDITGIFISSPIEKLTKDVEKASEGNLTHRTSVKLENEIGTLALTYNKMAIQLEDLYGSLDDKVKKQTANLTQQRNSLVRQQKQMIDILKDLEEEKERSEDLTEQLRKFELAVESSSNHIVITDHTGVIIYANPAVETLTGFKVKDLIGQKAGNSENWGGQMSKDFYKDLWTTISVNKDTFNGQLKNKKKDGSVYDVHATISPVLDEAGKIQFFVGIETDISKEIEIDRAKTEFVSLASHQLRTPLSAISWYTEMLMDGDAGPITIAQKEYLSEIYEGNARMIDLVSALLNVSRLEMGTFSIEPIEYSLITLAKDALKELAPLITEKQIEIKATYAKNIKDIPLDKRLTYIIFQNILSNAVKYTPKKGKVTLDISKNNRYITIMVKDSGMGIPKKEQANIFSKLFRASNARDKVIEGTGLGLYIVKAILDAVEGKISFKSVEGKGTTFTVKVLTSGMKAKKGTKKL